MAGAHSAHRTAVPISERSQNTGEWMNEEYNR